MSKDDKLSLYLGCILLILIFTFMIPVESDKTSERPKFETVTIAEHTQETTFKATDIIETYDVNGDKLYTVKFKDDSNKARYTCEIPVKFEDKLSKEVIYKGDITISYLEEFYNQINYGDKDIAELLKVNNSGQEVSKVNFVFTKFIVDGIKTEKEITDQFTRIYKDE